MISISWAMAHAKHYHDDKTFLHVLRVMGYISEMYIIPEEKREECMALALMHDLLEDTDFYIGDIPNSEIRFKKALQLLTRNKAISYSEYCKNIKLNFGCYDGAGELAYWVKLADIKDHLSQKETLTDELKEKYIEGLTKLL